LLDCGRLSVPVTGIWSDWPFRPASSGCLVTQASWMGICSVIEMLSSRPTEPCETHDDVADLELDVLVIDATIDDTEVHLLVANR